ncbi:MAG: acetyltransferase-like isoleucine patch superfamily enzyme [Bacteriovoracaceae bacterium]|jgi:acetyltransferase-like isoleucine patch superfamily enzyme
MTLLSKAMTLFPLIHAVLIFISLFFFAKGPSAYSSLIIPMAIYLFPLISFRIMNLFYPINEGRSDLAKDKYSPWWGGHQIQLLFYVVPQFEAFLRIIPGGYSLWLRLWGSKVGKGVYWTPNVEIDDRSMVEIGNHVLFGHKVELISHVVGGKKGNFSLYSKNIVIGDGSFVGAGSRLGPGAEIEAGCFLPVLSDIYVDEYIPKKHSLKYKHPRWPIKKKEDYLS